MKKCLLWKEIEKQYFTFQSVRLILFLAISLQLFSVSTHAQHTKLMDLTGANGRQPWGSLISDGTFLYGMTNIGGANNMGTIFKIRPDGSDFSKLLDFAGITNGSAPRGSLLFDGTFLYGMTSTGGTNNFGTIFKILPNGSGFVKLLDFNGTVNGRLPWGSLISDGTFLYGMTSAGGAGDLGTVFKIRTDGTDYTKVFEFSTAVNGRAPLGSLYYDGTFLYGMTGNGGSNDDGTIFKVRPDGTGYLKLLNFSRSTTGEEPFGTLISDGTFLYGMTPEGGAGSGTIFKIRLDGTAFSKIFDFLNDDTGNTPYGSLILKDGVLYGVTYFGGLEATGNHGTLFSIKPDGTQHTVLRYFSDFVNGDFPVGSLLADGSFLYGMTEQGGANDAGTIFSYELSATSNQPPVIEATTETVQIGGILTIDLTELISDPDDNVDFLTLSVSNTTDQGALASLDDFSFELTLDYTGIQFTGTDYITVGICDLAGECVQAQLVIEVGGDIIIYNAVSPNGNGLNEIFRIQSVNLSPSTASNRVTIFNRWGDVVFDVSNYNNNDRVFKGVSNSGKDLPSGTYYYKIEFTSGLKPKTGYLSLKR